MSDIADRLREFASSWATVYRHMDVAVVVEGTNEIERLRRERDEARAQLADTRKMYEIDAKHLMAEVERLRGLVDAKEGVIKKLTKERDARREEVQVAQRACGSARRERDTLRAEAEHQLGVATKMTELANEEGLKAHALEAEAERLRGALSRISAEGCEEIGDYDCHSVTEDCPTRGENAEDWCGSCIARAALAGEGET